MPSGPTDALPVGLGVFTELLRPVCKTSRLHIVAQLALSQRALCICCAHVNPSGIVYVI